MDDCFVDDPTGSLMVAGMDLCMARLWSRRAVHSTQRSSRSNLSRHVPSRRKDKFRSLRESLVHLQPRRDGMHMVRRSSKHRRRLCQGHATSDVAERQQHS